MAGRILRILYCHSKAGAQRRPHTEREKTFPSVVVASSSHDAMEWRSFGALYDNFRGGFDERTTDRLFIRSPAAILASRQQASFSIQPTSQRSPLLRSLHWSHPPAGRVPTMACTQVRTYVRRTMLVGSLAASTRHHAFLLPRQRNCLTSSLITFVLHCAAND